MDINYETDCATTSQNDESAAGRVKKRRFSSALMQSDEDIGRMVASVPVAIGSAMEHFAESLLKSAQRCVPQSACKTKLAVMQNTHFQFLEHLVKEVEIPKLNSNPNLSPSTPASSSNLTQQINGEVLNEESRLNTFDFSSKINSENHHKNFANSFLLNTSQSAIPHNFFPSFYPKIPQQQFNDLTQETLLNPSTPLQHQYNLIKDPITSKNILSQNTIASSQNCIMEYSNNVNSTTDDTNNRSGLINRKRGRPKKDCKEKLVKIFFGLHFRLQETYGNLPESILQRNRNSRLSEEEGFENNETKNKLNGDLSETESERLLMPPPSKLPVRSPFKGSRECTTRTTSSINSVFDLG